MSDPVATAMRRLKELSCPTHRSFVLELDGSRRCNFIGCSWTLPAAPPEADVMERARNAIARAISPQRWSNLNAGEESRELAAAQELLAHALTEYGDQRALGERERILALLREPSDELITIASREFWRTPEIKGRTEQFRAAIAAIAAKLGEP